MFDEYGNFIPQAPYMNTAPAPGTYSLAEPFDANGNFIQQAPYMAETTGLHSLAQPFDDNGYFIQQAPYMATTPDNYSSTLVDDKTQQINQTNQYLKPDPFIDQGGNVKLQGAGMMASGALGVAGGITDIIQGTRNLRDARADQASAQSEIDKLKASQPSLSTPAEYYEAVKNAYDSRLMQMRTEDINRNLANTTAAAASFGSRGLGALAGATQAANRAQRQEVLTQQQLQTQNLQQLAQAQQNTIDRKEARNVRETQYAQSQLEAAKQAAMMAQQQRMSGIASTVGGVAQAGMGFGALRTGNELLDMGANIAGFEKGGKVQKTPGKFSHKENEMAVVTEDGEDTGIRVTGGEYVLNPKQARAIKMLVESGDAKALMKYMDNLLDEPQFA